MKRRSLVLLHLVLALSLLPVPATATSTPPPVPDSAPYLRDRHTAPLLYRTTVRLATPHDLTRLADLNIQVLEQRPDAAVVLVDEDQLATLARLRYEPQGTEAVDALVAAYAEPWLRTSLRPLLQEAATVQARLVGEEAPRAKVLASLRASLRALAPVIQAALAVLPSNDQDGDGLTDTEESWWCTNPSNPDTDSDGKTDGQEIKALRDWVANRRTAPPFETPWPDWPFAQAGSDCLDKDFDAIPNLAEHLDLGLSMDLESTDGDRFDDGQEVFGVTYCPGSGGACGYGNLPAPNPDGVLPFSQMPAWVTPPGSHPMVPAYPKIKVNLLSHPDAPNQQMIKIVTTTVITTDTRIEQGTTLYFLDTHTTGTTTADTDTETWEEWESVANTTETPNTFVRDGPDSRAVEINAAGTRRTNKSINITQNVNMSTTAQVSTEVRNVIKVVKEETPLLNKVVRLEKAADFVLDEACAEINCKKMAGAAVRSAVRTVMNLPNIIQKNLGTNECAKDLLGKIGCTLKAAGTALKQTFDKRMSLPDEDEDTQRDQGTGNVLTSDGTNLDVSKVYPVQYPQPRFVPTTTETKGSSHGGSRSHTTTQYDLMAATRGHTTLESTSTGRAIAENTAHAADLWFDYKVANVGSDYARSICNLILNVFVGEERIGSVLPFSDLAGGCLANFRPGQEATISLDTNKRVGLTLEQLLAINRGAPVRVVVEDYSLGQDDFYADQAISAGVTVAIDDGTADGDGGIESFVIARWSTEDTARDIIERYFASGYLSESDAQGNLSAIWVPKWGLSETPGWCDKPQRPQDNPARVVWCKHALSTSEWFNLYLDKLDDGTSSLQETPAQAGATMLFRFNEDSDGDGYSDRTERRLMCAEKTEVECQAILKDPRRRPSSDPVVGVYHRRTGNDVESILIILNPGQHDLHGVEAVMIAPDSSVEVTNNTVGGAGKVPAKRQLVLGSTIRVQEPLLTPWPTTGHARPAAGGYYIGTGERIYTFTVQCGTSGGCQVGQNGSWGLTWTDNVGGIGGPISFGDGYQSPLPKDVASGVKLAMVSGRAQQGESFTVTARPARDTFNWTTPDPAHYTEPIVIVSYTDFQGAQRLVTPLRLDAPDVDLSKTEYQDKMLPDPGLRIVITGPAVLGANTTSVLINNPTETTIEDASILIDFVAGRCPESRACNVAEGTVVREVSVSQDVPPGPTVVGVPWNTNDFSPSLESDRDYLALAFLTDYQGNILDTAGRPLSSFQKDPKPAFPLSGDDLTWNFGSVPQGTLLQHDFPLPSTGFLDLKTYLGASTVPGLSVSGGPALRAVSPGALTNYTVALNTLAPGVDVGEYSKSIPVRTSDPANAQRNLTIHGFITAAPVDPPGGVTVWPLDVPVQVPAGLTQGTAYDYLHLLGPSPETLQPVKVYNSDNVTERGVGKAVAGFGGAGSAGDLFGNGQDNDWTVTGTEDLNPVRASANGSKDATSLTVTNPVGDFGSLTKPFKVTIHQTRGANAGAWELNDVLSVSGNQLTLKKGLSNGYVSDGAANRAQVLWVKQFKNLTVAAGATIAPAAWDGNTGGIVAAAVSGSMSVDGTISVVGKGYVGGTSSHGSSPGDGEFGKQGEGTAGSGGGQTKAANGSGGGGGKGNEGGDGGGGGGNGSSGISGNTRHNIGDGGTGGTISGNDTLASMTFGGAGGSGGGEGNANSTSVSGFGGSGGGIAIFDARVLNINGTVATDGSPGGNGTGMAEGSEGSGGGGGGAGGSILVRSQQSALGQGRLRANGGPLGLRGQTGFNGSGDGGTGGDGRIRVEYCDQPPAGSTNPPAVLGKLNCYIVEQTPGAPTHGSLRLPDDSGANGRTYMVGYGRELDFAGASTQNASIQVANQVYSGGSLTLYVSPPAGGSSTGPVTLSLDVDGDGTPEWGPQQVTLPTQPIEVNGLAPALGRALAAQAGAAGAAVTVPFKVQSDNAVQVIVANLVLTRQSNSTSALVLASVETGADRPLDKTVTVPGGFAQNQPYTFDHGLQPEVDSLHPCRVFDQSGTILKGVGKNCSDFGGVTATLADFGRGTQDRTVTGNEDLNSTHANVLSNLDASTVSVSSVAGFVENQKVLIHQTRGQGAGNWEINEIATVDGASVRISFKKPLTNGYDGSSSGSRAQIVVVPQFHDVTVTSTGTISPAAWDGSVGGIVAVMASGTMRVSGRISANGGDACNSNVDNSCGAIGGGFRGGNNSTDGSNAGSGEGYEGPWQIEDTRAHGNGGDGAGRQSVVGGPGASGGHAFAGHPGSYAEAGGAAGDPNLRQIYFGGGGGGAHSNGDSQGGGGGGAGGGIIVLIGRQIIADDGTIVSNGGHGGAQNANGKDGGGGAGGAIFLKTGAVNLRNNAVTALGGASGTTGGFGSVGRVHIKYCSDPIGSTSPGFTYERLNCYIADQAQADATKTTLTLPDASPSTYIVQYGQRYASPSASIGEIHRVRIRQDLYSNVRLDALVSPGDGGGNPVNVKLFVGTDTTPAVDRSTTATSNELTDLGGADLAAALNRYLQQQAAAPGSPVNVSLTVKTDGAAKVMLTNLRLTPVGARTRYVRLAARQYSALTLEMQLGRQGETASGPLAFSVNMGADSSIEWSGTLTNVTAGQIVTSPTSVATAIAAAANQAIGGNTTGEVIVPVRVSVSQALTPALVSYSATLADAGRPDLTVGSITVPMDPTPLVESDELNVTVAVHNAGPVDSGPAMVTLTATPPRPEGSPIAPAPVYVGSAFVANVPPAVGATPENTPVTVVWDTTGFFGAAVTLTANVVSLVEAQTAQGNNSKLATLSINTRADLLVRAIEPPKREPVVGVPVTVKVKLRNNGQTVAPESMVALFLEAPKPDQSNKIADHTLAVPPGAEVEVPLSWTPSKPGLQRLFAVSDLPVNVQRPLGEVNESDEGNNQAWESVYVGLSDGRLEADSGPTEVLYSATRGFGAVQQPNDLTLTCDTGIGVEKTVRMQPTGSVGVVYRYDHLLPNHTYHLDLTMNSCDDDPRTQTVRVNGEQQGDPIVVGPGAQRVSFRLDPVLYADLDRWPDHSITVQVAATGNAGAVISAISLIDVDYRYSDSGNDMEYTTERGFGRLPGGTPIPNAGPQPYQSYYINLINSAGVSYQFDNMKRDRRYKLVFTFWQPDGSQIATLQVRVNGQDVGSPITVPVSGGRPTPIVFADELLPSLYNADGRMIVSILRLNAQGTPRTSAFVNEVALEEDTLAPPPRPLAFLSQPVKGAHTFGLGVQPVVAVQQGGVTNAADNTTVVTLRIRPDTGTRGASLSCGARGTTQTMVNGVARWGDPAVNDDDCTIDLKGDGYVLEATAAGAILAATAPFSVVWAGDANGDCLVDILDFSVLANRFGKHLGDSGYDARADLNGDNGVDILDFSVLATLFGTRCPSLTLAPISGPTGTVVTVTGSGYVANREVSITLDGTVAPTAPPLVTTGAGGGFTASFSVPAGTTAGTHVVKASQQNGKVIAAATLTVP